MSFKKGLITFILNHSPGYNVTHLETLTIESLVILKVEIELKLRENKNNPGNQASSSRY
jgi:hypothetical protein